MIRPLMARVRSLFRAAARADAMNRDVHEEFEFHIEQRAQDLAGDGVALDEARRRARLEFGSSEWYAEEARASRGIAWWDEAQADARYAYRQLRASPLTYTAAAVVIAVPFALMISAYALVDGILLKPLPMPGAERVAGLWERMEGSAPDVLTRVAPPVFTRWRADTVHFETVAGWGEESVVYSGGGSAARLAVAAATPELFELFGARPLLGRFYSTNDDRVGAPGVVVLSHALWSMAFGSDTGVVGRSMRLDGRPYTIVGVAPPVVQPPGGSADLFMPLAPFLAGAEDVAGAKILLVAGRLRPTANRAVVREQLERSSESVPGNDGWSADVVPLQEQLTGPARSGLLLLLAGGVLVMLIACANVAALLLSRAPVRARELSMRSALGASRARLVRQLFTESLILAVIACGVGVALSAITLDAVLSLGPGDLPRRSAIAVDLRVLAFGTAGLAGVLLAIGTAPALLATRSAATTHWRAASDRLSTGPAGRRITRSLTAAEVAITVVLLGTATLLLQSFRSVMAVDPGFQPDRVTTVDLSLAQHRYDAPETWAAFVAELVSRVQAATGTDLVAVSNNVPVSGRNMTSPLVVPGRQAATDAADPRAHVAAVTPEFFGTLGIGVMRGRSFASTDRAGAPPVAIISESLANELFPGQNPLGRQLRSMFGAPVLREVVGVVDDVHQTALTDAPAAVYYTPFAQDPKPALTLLVSSDRDAGAVVSVVRAAVRSIDVEQPITRTATMDELLSDSVARLRFLLRLIGVIATVALLVALCGVYATMAATVEERRGEIGVRMALGARAITVVRMVLWDGGRYIIAGTVIGVPLLLASRRFFEGFLFGVHPDDPRVLAIVCLAVLVAALAGMLQPARTATRVDPATVLRR